MRIEEGAEDAGGYGFAGGGGAVEDQDGVGEPNHWSMPAGWVPWALPDTVQEYYFRADKISGQPSFIEIENSSPPTDITRLTANPADNVSSEKFPVPSFLYRMLVSSAKYVLKMSKLPSKSISAIATPMPACSMPSSLTAASRSKASSLKVPFR